MYVQMIGHAIEMAEQLGCETYFHEQVDKAAILQRFMSRQHPVIVVMSAMGHRAGCARYLVHSPSGDATFNTGE